MKGWIKAVCAAALLAAAFFSARAAVGGILGSASAEAAAESPFVYEASCSYCEAEYILRDFEGYVCVFMPDGGDTPVSVTNIATDTLRGTDRALLADGIAVSSHDELLSLLEDLGS